MLKPPAYSYASSTRDPNVAVPTYGRVLRSLASEPGQVSLKAGYVHLDTQNMSYISDFFLPQGTR